MFYILSIFLSVFIEHFHVESFQMSFQDNYRPCNHSVQEYDDHYHQKCTHPCVCFFSKTLQRKNGSLTV